MAVSMMLLVENRLNESFVNGLTIKKRGTTMERRETAMKEKKTKPSSKETTIKEVEVAATLLLHRFLSTGKLEYEKLPTRNDVVLNAVRGFVERQAKVLKIHPAKILYWLAFPSLLGDEMLVQLISQTEQQAPATQG